jgi:hypothetical protein
MPEEIRLPVIAAALLVWGLVCALSQRRADTSAEPRLVWRQATANGWSDWHDLEGISASAEYSAVLREVRERASDDATAVQFACVAHPAGAPGYTLRVLFMSGVRTAGPDRDPALN